MTYVIMLAGGSGRRFWPLSRSRRPKQFLRFTSGRNSLEEAIIRVRPLVSKKNIYLAVNRRHQPNLKGCGLKPGNILLEPEARNNLAPLALLSRRIYRRDKDALIIALPCDQQIKGRQGFIRSLRLALEAAARGYIVTLGTRPSRPETGYGYIQQGPRLKALGLAAYKIERFVEKPRLAEAREFLRAQGFYWNAGIFIFRAELLLEELKKYAPLTNRIINKIDNRASLQRLWPRLESLSIDYGVMEKTTKAAFIPAGFIWEDLGSLRALETFFKPDKAGNIFKGNCIDKESTNSTVWAGRRLVATLGLKDIIVIDTDDVLLVSSKERCQQVKELVAGLKAKAQAKLT
jgi:mannose-1-phosphate guanylyltransferase/mannose-6-phosphate isomerase